MTAVDIGPFQNIIGVSWGGGADCFGVAASFQKGNPTLGWRDEDFSIVSTNFGIEPFDILHPGLNLPASGFPSALHPPPITSGSIANVTLTGGMASFYSCWRYIDARFGVGLEKDSARQNILVLNLTKIRKLFPSISSLALSGTLSGDLSNNFLAVVNCGYIGKVTTESPGNSPPTNFKAMGPAIRDFAITVDLTDPSISTLT